METLRHLRSITELMKNFIFTSKTNEINYGHHNNIFYSRTAYFLLRHGKAGVG